MDDDRRKICQVTGLAMVGALLPSTSGGCGGGTSAVGGVVNAGPTSQVVLGDVLELRVPDHNIDICRDEKGLYALCANCTHARCVVTFQSRQDGFLCGCHNSTYDYNGEHNTPPAPAPLPHYKLTVDGSGNMLVDTGQIVAATDRTPG